MSLEVYKRKPNAIFIFHQEFWETALAVSMDMHPPCVIHMLCGLLGQEVDVRTVVCDSAGFRKIPTFPEWNKLLRHMEPNRKSKKKIQKSTRVQFSPF